MPLPIPPSPSETRCMLSLEETVSKPPLFMRTESLQSHHSNFKFAAMHSGSRNSHRIFQDFFDGWLLRRRRFLDELLSVPENSNDDDHLRYVITRVLAHYEQYYQEKSRIAHQDIFLVFSPPWFTPFEQSFLWIAGFKPSLAYRVLHGSVRDLSEDQRCQLAKLKDETRLIQKILHNEVARVQESVASPPLLEWAKRAAEGETSGEGMAVERLRSEMEGVVGRADVVRMSTVMRVVEILSPQQNMKFLTAVTEMQVKVRDFGTRWPMI